MISVTLYNQTLGVMYRRRFPNRAEVNKWIDRVQTPDDGCCPFPDELGNCTCHIVITVQENKEN